MSDEIKVLIVPGRTEPSLSINLESGLPQEPVLCIPASMAGDTKEINRLIIRSDSAYKRMKESMSMFISRCSRDFEDRSGKGL